jgi:LPS export ABC transporter permease LptG
MSDKVFKGTVTWFTIGDYFRHATPEWLYYALPLAVLLSTLVTIAVMTKNNELIVMKACGISLYRVGLPMFAAALVAGAGLFALQETILGPSTRRAEEIRHLIRGGSAETFDVRSNRWIVGSRGEIYHYASLNPRQHVITGLDVFEFSPRMERLTRRSYVELASYQPPGEAEPVDLWQVNRGWAREFRDNEPPQISEITVGQRRLETPEYFGAEEPNPRFMGYAQLRNYTTRLRAGGFDVVEQEVSLNRKLAFPFVTLIMTLLAVPFASTIGRSGAMGGIAVGIALAISYWTLISVFAALGSGGALPPVLAAWAPNLLFGSAALYLLLTVRT